MPELHIPMFLMLESFKMIYYVMSKELFSPHCINLEEVLVFFNIIFLVSSVKVYKAF